MATIGATASRPRLWGAQGWPWILLVFATAVFGFWKPYFSQLGAAQVLTHLHAIMMLAWIGMLVAQPVLIRSRRLAWHRRIGRMSYVVVPLVVLSAFALAQRRLSLAPPQMLGLQQQILFIGLGTAVLFAAIWVLAIRHRREPALHARYMAGTALTLIDPSLVRVMIFWVPSVPPPLYQWITFGLVYAILLLLLALDRKTARARSAWLLLLASFGTLHALNMLVPGTPSWQAFAQWYAGL